MLKQVGPSRATLDFQVKFSLWSFGAPNKSIQWVQNSLNSKSQFHSYFSLHKMLFCKIMIYPKRNDQFPSKTRKRRFKRKIFGQNNYSKTTLPTWLDPTIPNLTWSETMSPDLTCLKFSCSDLPRPNLTWSSLTLLCPKKSCVKENFLSAKFSPRLNLSNLTWLVQN